MNKKIKTIFIVIALLFVSGMLTGCAKEKEGNEKEVITDTSVEKIVCLAPNLTEIIFALGEGDKIAGVSSNSDYPEEVKDIQQVGSFWQPDIETILALDPDLVLTLEFQQQKATAKKLKNLDMKVESFDIMTLEELYDATLKIGELIGRQKKAEGIVKDIKSKLAEQKRKHKTGDPVKVLWVVQDDPLRVVGRKSFVNKLIRIAGGENAIGATIHQYPPISTEELLAAKPEVVIISSMSEGEIEEERKQAIEEWGKYPEMPAVRDGRIFVVDPDVMFRLGPRVTEGVEQIAEILNKKVTEEKN